MTNPNATFIGLLADRSWSMTTIKDAAEKGVDSFIDEQRNAEGTCRVSLVQFDDQYDEDYLDMPVIEVPKFVLVPRGSTALLDAMGRFITDTGKRLAKLPESERPGTVIIAIVTDGKENASTKWERPAIKALVEQQTEKYGWKFLYMGANQDAVEVGAGMGIAADYAVTFTPSNVDVVASMTSQNIVGYRGSVARGLADDSLLGYTEMQRRSALYR